MIDPVHDECGVVAVYLMDPAAADSRGEIYRDESVTPLVPRMLLDLQNRGQLAAGLTSFCPDRERLLDTYKELGPVGEVFRLNHQAKFQSLMARYRGTAAIGHVRYATCGPDDVDYAQPRERQHGRRWKWYSFCFNGNIANYAELRQQLMDRQDYHLVLDNDTEIIMHHISRCLAGDEKPDFVSMFRSLAADFDGAYCLALLTADGDLVVARDPYGFRPMCFGVKGNLFAAASESLPLTNLDFPEVHSLEPGTLIHVRPEGWKIHRFADSPRKAHCYFEWVYFSNVASTINGKSVYQSRRRMGEELAAKETVPLGPDCIAVPVPDTAKAACDAFAWRLGLQSVEGLIRNRSIGRTFIEGKSRREKALLKYTPLPDVLSGKRIFLVEDSIVRSTTLRVIIQMLRDKGGAKEVHVRVACPPVMAPCNYGIDMSTVRELFAPHHLERPIRGELPAELTQKLAADLGADSLRYLSVESLPVCIDLPEKDLCLACLTGEYPTACGEQLYRVALEDARSGDQDGRRTYERQPAVKS